MKYVWSDTWSRTTAWNCEAQVTNMIDNKWSECNALWLDSALWLDCHCPIRFGGKHIFNISRCNLSLTQGTLTADLYTGFVCDCRCWQEHLCFHSLFVWPQHSFPLFWDFIHTVSFFLNCIATCAHASSNANHFYTYFKRIQIINTHLFIFKIHK